jgi:hypothetical protein
MISESNARIVAELKVQASPQALAIINDLEGDWAAYPAPGAPRAVSAALNNVKPTQEIKLEKSGELVSYLDGARRVVLVSSIFLRLMRLAIKSYPLGGPPAVARQPPGRYRAKAGKPRALTPQELAGLRKGNERRHAEAVARRAAKVAH